MRKNFYGVLLIVILVVFCVACGKNNTPTEKKEKFHSETSKEVTEETDDIQNSQEEAWGVDESIITEKNNTDARAYIKFPFLAGIIEGQGKIAYQTDNTLVILGSEIDYQEPEVRDDKVENVFPAYFEQIKGIFEDYRRVNYKNFEFKISEKKVITVNDYEMCKFKGEHTFTIDGQQKSMGYVAYATKLKANDAFVYWMVLDESAEQSLDSTIESHAKKMAESLHE